MVIAVASTATGAASGQSRWPADDSTLPRNQSFVWLAGRAPNSAFSPASENILLSLLNSVRLSRGIALLKPDAALRNIARAHSRSMALRGFVGHDSPTGESFAERLSGVLAAGTAVGENVAFAERPSQAHDAFLASAAHTANMLSPVFRRVGIGVATAGGFGLAITELFAG
ncbi:MAG TPA: CAP domain-containing protein [bacterium]|nr:CAP domain-containing protein [bacterium]